MKVVVHRINYKSRTDTFRIYGIGDIHWGHVFCAEKVLKEDVAAIAKSKHTYWIGMGDYTEGLSIYDKHFHPESVHPRYRDSIQSIRELTMADAGCELAPIAKQCLGMIEGNHNAIRLANARIIEPEAPRVARQMGLKSDFIDRAIASDMLLIVLLFTRKEHDVWTCKINVSHGCQASRKKGAGLNRLEEVFAQHDVHVVMRAHNHQRTSAEFVRVEYVGDDFHPFVQTRIGGYTGSYMKVYETGGHSYAAAADYPASALGCWGVEIVPDKRLILEGRRP